MATKNGSKMAKKGGSNMDVFSLISGGISLTMSVVERAAALRSSKDKDEYIAAMDEKIDQVGAATLELDGKVAIVNEQLDATRKEVQLLKKIILGMGIALGVAIVAIVVSFII